MVRLLRFLKREDIKSFIRLSWSVSWPMTLIMLFEFLITLADVYIAGKIGKEVQAAYGFVTQLYFIFSVIANALIVGTVSVVSRLCPEKNTEEYYRSIYSSVVSAAGIGIVLVLFGIFLTPFIIKYLNVPDVVKRYGTPLFQIYAGGLLFHYLLINTNGILRACKGIKKSLRTMLIVCITNIGLNFYLVFYTSIGYKGIALSTALSVFIGCALNMINVWGLITQLMHFSRIAFRRIISIGWPAGMLQVLWQLGAAVLFLILSALPENNIEILAAFTNGMRIESAIFLPAFAFNMANAVIVGNLLAEKGKDDAFRGGLITGLFGVLVVSVITVVVVINARWIVSFLSENTIVINESVRYLYIIMISEPYMAWAVILSGGLSGAGDTKSVMFIVGISIWFVRIPASFIFGVVFGFGALGVWWSMNLSLLVQAIFVTKRYFQRRWLIRA